MQLNEVGQASGKNEWGKKKKGRNCDKLRRKSGTYKETETTQETEISFRLHKKICASKDISIAKLKV